MKICTDCKREKPLDQFWKANNELSGLRTQCKECDGARQKAWRVEDPERAHEKDRRSWLKSKYSMTILDYDAILASQGGGCAICGTKVPGGHGRFHIDHDHRCCPKDRKLCGKCIRGLLCNSCNQGIGKLADDPDLLRRAADYIERFQMSTQQTNVKDRYKAWRADPQTVDNPTLVSAFLEGFTQGVEAVTGQLRDPTVTSDELSEGWDDTDV